MIDSLFEVDSQDLCRKICGPQDQNIQYIEQYFDVQISARGNALMIRGSAHHVQQAEMMLHQLSDYFDGKKNTEIDRFHIRFLAQSIKSGESDQISLDLTRLYIAETQKTVLPRSLNQAHYISTIQKKAITFGVGPAGTGKTYLAVAVALHLFSKGAVSRIVLTRPAVEAGESLGYLPGDFIQKINPYLRPLYDALFDLAGFERVHSLIENNTIEIAPLAYMRGRTLNNAFVILDEAQNTTISQMKMFLTRMGSNSRIVVSGDVTQIDIERPEKSGLIHASKVLRSIPEIGMIHFNSDDICRHPVVEKIVRAYEEHN
jgi:phosphate starvation-inducible PhoH-like protein